MLNRIILTSPMRVGSAWVKKIILDLTTKPLNELKKHGVSDGFKGDIKKIPLCTTTKVHARTPKKILEIFPDAKVISMTRDLCDSIVSLYFFLKHDPLVKSGQHAYSKYSPKEPIQEYIRTEKFKKILKDYKLYEENYEHPNHLRITYKEMYRNPHKTTKKIADFIDAPFSSKFLEEVVEKNTFKHTTGREKGEEARKSKTRKGIIGDKYNHLSEKDRKYIKKTYKSI